MKKLSFLLVTLLVASPAIAAGHKGSMETCMKVALAKHAGTVISLEAEIENKKPIYEFDIKGNDGKEWEVECDAKSGKVTEEEEMFAVQSRKKEIQSADECEKW